MPKIKLYTRSLEPLKNFHVLFNFHKNNDFE